MSFCISTSALRQSRAEAICSPIIANPHTSSIGYAVSSILLKKFAEAVEEVGVEAVRGEGDGVLLRVGECCSDIFDI